MNKLYSYDNWIAQRNSEYAARFLKSERIEPAWRHKYWLEALCLYETQWFIDCWLYKNE